MGLGFVFTARDLASGAVQRLERNFVSLNRSVGAGSDRMQRAFRAMGVGLATMSAGLVAVGGAFALAHAAGEFEQNIAAVGVISNASAEELRMLHDAAIDAGIATQFSPNEAALGLRELAAAGFDARESMQLLVPVLDMAAGSLGELTVEAAAGLAAQAVHAFGLEVGDTSFAIDQMLSAANQFAVRAGELPLAIGIVSRGAQALHQTLPETLAAWGLVKNVIPTVERSSTALAVAMERLVNPRAQRQLQQVLGVRVIDQATGRFRPFLDILSQMAPRLERMSEAARSAFLHDIFGVRSGAVSAILGQLSHGIRNETGELLRGANAVEHLRHQFDDAEGTAARFREAMLGTFRGQVQLLRGSLETMLIVLGEPMGEVLRPAVTAVVEALNVLLDLFRGLPAPARRAFAAFLVAAGAFATLVGGAVVAGATIALLGGVLEAIGTAVGVVLALLAPAIVLVGLWGVAVAGLAIGFRRNLGGAADFFQSMVRRVQLGYRALIQLFEHGGFSGVVLEELDRAENAGVRRFAIAVFRLAFRVQQAWEGLKDGFEGAIVALAPLFEQLRAAVSELWGELDGLFSTLLGGANDLPSDSVRDFGRTIGNALGVVVRWVAEGLVRFTRFASGVVAGFRLVLQHLRPAFTVLSEAFGRLIEAWNRATGATDESTDSWRTFGRVVGVVLGIGVGIAMTTLAALIDLVGFAIRAFTWLDESLSAAWGTLRTGARATGAVLGAVAARVARFFASMADAVRHAFTSVVDTVIRLVRRIPAPLLPDSLRGVARMPLSTERPTARTEDGRERTARTAAQARAASSRTPAAAEAADRGSLLGQVHAQLTALLGLRRAESERPITVQLQVDGQTLAEATRRADRDAAARSFSPVPTY
jgi:TP901 family phage tail tape measure protein